MTKKLRIGIIDVVAKGPENALFARVMNANLASIMPQAIGAWCSKAGHDVTYVCYTGFENLIEELPKEVDLVFVSAFTEGAHLTYAISNLFQTRGAVTVLGGPHARCYPQDAARFFDYVVGFASEELIADIVAECAPRRSQGLMLGATDQPRELPSVRERWPFIAPTIRKAPFFKLTPVLGSLGCPYTCSFCIDASIKYQPLDFDGIQEDLSFLLTKFRRPLIGWHDPNFGIRFDEYLGVMERADPKGRIRSIAESSLSILSEDRLKRMQRQSFFAMLPGVESWFALGNKAASRGREGMAKVEQVSEQVRMILRYIPYVQTNFVLGLDTDQGDAPFELTKKFLDMTPGTFPGYSLLTSFGQAAELNLSYQRAGRVLPFPFFLLNNNGAMNVRPANYEWTEFYDRIIDLVRYSFSTRGMYQRLRNTNGTISKLINLLRGVSSEGRGRLAYHMEVRRRLDEDPEFRPFYEQETTKIPSYFTGLIRQSLGPFFDWLPDGALEHDPLAYLRSKIGDSLQTVVETPRVTVPPRRRDPLTMETGLPT